MSNNDKLTEVLTRALGSGDGSALFRLGLQIMQDRQTWEQAVRQWQRDQIARRRQREE